MTAYCLGGGNITAGYYKMPEKTEEEYFDDATGRRWFRSGDIGQVAGIELALCSEVFLFDLEPRLCTLTWENKLHYYYNTWLTSITREVFLITSTNQYS